MEILVSNDDGIDAPGLRALMDALSPFGHITIVAPANNVSTASSSLTVGKDIDVKRISKNQYVVSGTPADCVHLALTGLIDFKPDLVVSGINSGCNLGDDTIYSGTVACAIQGYLFGIDAIAISQTESGWLHLETAAKVASTIVEHLIAKKTEKARLINVNVPMIPFNELKGIRITRLGKRGFACPCVRNAFGTVRIGKAGDPSDVTEDTDFYAVDNGYASVTPLQVDFSDREALNNVSTWIREFV